MDDPWRVLMEAGVPLGAPRQPPRQLPSGSRMRLALDLLVADLSGLRTVEREALAAWLCAWSSHWPSSFRERLSEEGGRALAMLSKCELDEGRHVKLRRIAVANLAGAGI